MSQNDPDARLPRRSLLTYMASATGLLGLDALGVQQAAASVPRPASAADAYALQLATLRYDQTRRSSSYDRTGGNGDAVGIDPGETVTVLETTGPGVISHLWFTINSPDAQHLKTQVLRAYWDGEETPSVEAPIGDFFGLGLGEYFLYQSALLTVAPVKALNAYFPMPFRKSARITVTNEGPLRTANLYYNIDFYTVASLPEDLGYFHAQYRQQTPTHGITSDWVRNGEPHVLDIKNLDGANNYVFMEATGRGHLIGVTQAVLQNQDGWMGEGDEMIFIDGEKLPSINGTGTEDYYNGAWDFGGRNGAVPFSYPYNGAPYIVDAETTGGRICLYRWHTDNPVRFQKSLRMTIEHGHGNSRSDSYYTVAYWYQTEPHAAFPALPPAASRYPHLFQVGGPGVLSVAPDAKP
jgi:Protein of unknown function (DUF2961)